MVVVRGLGDDSFKSLEAWSDVHFQMKAQLLRKGSTFAPEARQPISFYSIDEH